MCHDCHLHACIAAAFFFEVGPTANWYGAGEANLSPDENDDEARPVHATGFYTAGAAGRVCT